MNFDVWKQVKRHILILIIVLLSTMVIQSREITTVLLTAHKTSAAVISQCSESVRREFGVLLRLIGQMNFILDLSLISSDQYSRRRILLKLVACKMKKKKTATTTKSNNALMLASVGTIIHEFISVISFSLDMMAKTTESHIFYASVNHL